MKKIAKKNAIKAYKVFGPDWKCRGFQFAVGEAYEHKGAVEICRLGFHACVQIEHCFSYYSFNSANKVAEVLIWGKTDAHDEDSKLCGSQIQIVREVEWSEVLALANHGMDNTGHSNTGDSNTGYRNTGAFCVDDNPEVLLFDKPSGIKVRDWEKHQVVRVMGSLEIAFWTPSWSMTEQEKTDHPSWQTTDGYLKNITLHEAWANLWGNLDDENKQVFLDLPNFDVAKWLEITGIEV